MSVFTRVSCCLALALVLAFSAPSFGDEGTPPADTVFVNGKVYTLDQAQPWADAVAVRGDRITYVGDAAGLRAHVGDRTRVIDCTGKTVMPGFVSAHDHLIASNWTASGVKLFGAKDKADCLARIKAYAEAHPDEKVVKGIGWNRGVLGGHPTAKELDAAVSDRPAILLDFTIHDAWLNTKALQAANITKDTKDTLPGVTYWVRDDAGNPTGAAIEIQWMKAYIDMGAWDPETAIRDSCSTLFGIAAKNGTTTILNPGIITPNVKDTHGGMERDFEAAMEMLQELEQKGELRLRVQALPFFKNAEADPARFVAFAQKMQAKYDGDYLRCDFVKIHPDGNWNASVSPFLEPYEGTDNHGSFNIQPAVIKDVTLKANAAGLSVVIHTDGDATARAGVDACEAAIQAGFGELRNSLHHLPWVHPDDYRRIVALKIPVNATPEFSTDWAGQASDSIRLLGQRRVDTEMGLYTELPGDGVLVSISADVPSTQADMQAPLFNVEVATTLVDPTRPGESSPWPKARKPMTVEQAIRAVTIDAAWMVRMEDKIGSLEVGKLADVVVLNDSPFDVKPADIAEIDVHKTMLGGRFTYEDGETAEMADAERVAMTAALAFASMSCCRDRGHDHDHEQIAERAIAMIRRDLAYLPASAQVELFKRGIIEPLDVVLAQKAMYDATEEKVNAVTFAHWDDAMRLAAESAERYRNGTARPLEGITVGVKDEHYDAGWVTTMGSLVHKDDPPKATADPLVAKLKAAGAIPVVQTTVPELYFNWVTSTLAWGTSRNPWNLKYAVGGSSGGSGAALAAGYCTIATGSDMGGSVRIPCSFNGCYGLKPAWGEVHTDNFLSYFAGSGPMARTFTDMVLMHNVINGAAALSLNVGPAQTFPLEYASVEGMKIAYLGGMGTSPMATYVHEAMMDAIGVLRAQGATVDVVDFDFDLKTPLTDMVGQLALGGAMGGMLREGYADKLEQMTHYGQYFVKKALNDGYGPDHLWRMEHEIRAMWTKLVDEVYAKGYDLVLCPTMPTAHVPADHDFTKKVPIVEDGVTYPIGVGMQYTLPWNLMNWCPVVNVPVGVSPEGMPIGMQIVGKPMETRTVLRAAHAYSRGGLKLYAGDLFPKGSE